MPNVVVDFSVAYVLSDLAIDRATRGGQVCKQYANNFVTSCGDLISCGALANRK